MTTLSNSPIDSKASFRRFVRFSVTSAHAAGLLAGCAAGSPNHAKFAANAQTALGKGSPDKAIALAEQAVLADPRNAAYRTLLGSAYLRAGRFEAARQAFDESMQLGEDSGKAALSLVLSDIALGRTSDATDTLNTYRDSIPAADYGLAMALAGQTQTGIAALTDALRHGENTPKVRQNLAYAYALDGSWREAKLMAQQDVPADKLNERIQGWASMSQPEDTRRRVAILIGAPLRADTGQPTALALANFPDTPKLVEEAVAKASEQRADSAADKATDSNGSALAEAAVAALPAAPIETAVAPQPSLADASSAPAKAQLAAIDLPPSSAAAPAAGAVRSVSIPVVQPIRASAAPAGQGTHVVQLGAFSSAEGAQRAWRHFAARHPGLGSYHGQFSEATVKGHKFYRVQAAGFAGFAVARQMCQSVRAKGGVCLVMAEPRMLTPQGRPASTRMAQR
jgi:tetratricopeptide (TPR) repeat protein